jgi:hypothetical protein
VDLFSDDDAALEAIRIENERRRVARLEEWGVPDLSAATKGATAPP